MILANEPRCLMLEGQGLPGPALSQEDQAHPTARAKLPHWAALPQPNAGVNPTARNRDRQMVFLSYTSRQVTKKRHRRRALQLLSQRAVLFYSSQSAVRNESIFQYFIAKYQHPKTLAAVSHNPRTIFSSLCFQAHSRFPRLSLDPRMLVLNREGRFTPILAVFIGCGAYIAW